jgi:hypothetical protein
MFRVSKSLNAITAAETHPVRQATESLSARSAQLLFARSQRHRTEFYGLMAAALVAAVAAVKHPRQLLEAAGEAARNVSCHFHIL